MLSVALPWQPSVVQEGRMTLPSPSMARPSMVPEPVMAMPEEAV